MSYEWLPRLLVPALIALVMGILRRIAPAPPAQESTKSYKAQPQAPELLPTGVIGATMWGFGICLGLTFFLLRAANHLWAQLDGPAKMHVYSSAALWCFFPIFAALSLPWPTTIWLLRRLGRTDEADSVTAEANRKGGMDMMRVMGWLNLVFVVPAGFFTILAIPMHLALSDSEVRVGRYAKVHSEIFRLDEAIRATFTDGTRFRDGSFHPARNLYVDFKDGRRLDLNAVGDGGSQVDENLIQFVLSRTSLIPGHVPTVEEIPPR